MDKWMLKYNLAKKYYEYYGNLDIPRNFKTTNGIDYDENGIKLGVWKETQKMSYLGKGNAKITSEQIKLLEKIGITWQKNEHVWNDNYELAKKKL